jgi:hypothetical protein
VRHRLVVLRVRSGTLGRAVLAAVIVSLLIGSLVPTAAHAGGCGTFRLDPPYAANNLRVSGATSCGVGRQAVRVFRGLFTGAAFTRQCLGHDGDYTSRPIRCQRAGYAITTRYYGNTYAATMVRGYVVTFRFNFT